MDMVRIKQMIGANQEFVKEMVLRIFNVVVPGDLFQQVKDQYNQGKTDETTEKIVNNL